VYELCCVVGFCVVLYGCMCVCVCCIGWCRVVVVFVFVYCYGCEILKVFYVCWVSFLSLECFYKQISSVF